MVYKDVVKFSLQEYKKEIYLNTTYLLTIDIDRIENDTFKIVELEVPKKGKFL
ncbi:MAG TPA: hypothetical protein PLK41_08590 [Defluviitoga tunisiensis]|nr:hypothetical protein [Defluviitoga tunisiensis]